MSFAEPGRFPEPWGLPTGYDRHQPAAEATRAAMVSLIAMRDWATLAWPELLSGLATLGRTDIPLARLSEGHVDAVRILAEAGHVPRDDALYGVWASRSHRTGLTARPEVGGWRISGTLRFASGAGIVDRALVPVWPSPDEHILLDVDVTGWVADESAWQTSAMQVSRSHTYVITDHFVDLSAQIGPSGFYLGRSGFFAGGVGVAAVWAGGAARLLDVLVAYAGAAPRSASRAIHLGHVRTELATMHALLAVAGGALEGGVDGGARVYATLTRAGIAAAVERSLGHIRHLAGPAGLAYATDLTRGIDDLDLYVRQLNPDSDAEYLGDLAG